MESGVIDVINYRLILNESKLISESLSGGVGENNTIAMNTLKWTTSKANRFRYLSY